MIVEAVAALLILASIGAVAFALFRHVWLALLVATGPAFGIVCAYAILRMLQMPTPPRLAVLLAHLLATGWLFLTLDDCALRLADGEERRRAAIGAARATLPTWAALFVIGIGLVLCTGLLLTAARIALSLVSLLLAALGFAVFAYFFASVLRFDEARLARMNRRREQLERWIAKLVPLTYPRWAFSLCGVTLVIATVAFFPAKDFVLASSLPGVMIAGALVAAALAALSWLAAREWRAAAAHFLALCALAPIAGWALARSGFAMGPVSFVTVETGFFAALAMVTVTAGRIAPVIRQGEDAGFASAQILNRYGAGVLGCSLMLTVALSVFAIFVQTSAIGFAVLAAACGLASVANAPALTIAAEQLFPRRAALEARYRVR